MKRSKVLREAARIAHDTPACGCWAIFSQPSRHPDNRDAAYEVFKLFKPDPIPPQYLGASTWFGRVSRDEEGQRHRVLALCFAAAIAEDEERAK